MGSFAEWGKQVGQGPVWLDGELLISESSGRAWPLRIARSGRPPVLTMPSGISVTQLTLPVQVNAPLTRVPFLGSLAWELDIEAHHESLEAAEAGELPVRVFFGWWVMDRWRAAQSPAGLVWRTSRPMPYGIVGSIDPSATDWAPTIKLDGTLQTVIETGTPTSGQVLIEANADLHYWTLTLPTATTFTELRALYPALMWARVGLSHEIPDVGRWPVAVSVEEVL